MTALNGFALGETRLVVALAKGLKLDFDADPGAVETKDEPNALDPEDDMGAWDGVDEVGLDLEKAPKPPTEGATGAPNAETPLEGCEPKATGLEDEPNADWPNLAARAGTPVEDPKAEV